MGRPSKRTPETEQAILDAIRAGNTFKHAAAGAGIHRDTLNQWRKDFPDFSAACEKAEAEAIARNVQTVQVAGEKHWQAAAWWLERRYPNEYGQRTKLEGGDAPIPIEIRFGFNTGLKPPE